ncbi:MAG: Mu transposase C-terminal domain-containing protein [Sulfuricellaceae bacterium]|nr:Mu transposase C-terminal domain-containing protein [Sulfuricellaceae bacterium]
MNPQTMTHADIKTIAAALGVSAQQAAKRANKEGWSCQEQPARGGQKRWYEITALPSPLQDALNAHRQIQDCIGTKADLSEHARAGRLIGSQLREEAESAARDAKLTRSVAGLEIMARWPRLTDNQVARMLGRMEVVQAYHQWFSTQQGKTPTAPLDQAPRSNGKKAYKPRKIRQGNKTLNTFSASYNTTGGSLVSSEARAVIQKTSGSNLRRWVEGFATLGLAGVLDEKDGKDKAGHGKIEDQPAIKELVVGLLVEFPHLSNKHIHDAICARFGNVLADVNATVSDAHEAGLIAHPSVDSVRRFRELWEKKHRSVYLALRNPDKWKNEQMLAFGDLAGDVTHPNYRWEMDSTPGDILLLDPDAASGSTRYHVIGVMDIWTRRFKMVVSKSSKSIAIGSLVRRAILDWGTPQRRKADNGADYQSNYLNRFFDAIGCEREDCAPFSGWQKAHVERGFRSFNHDLVELLPGYIGHNVAERKELEARASFSERLFDKDGVLEVSMNAAEFQQFCDNWCDKVYAHNPHAGLDGMTPFAMTAAWDKPLARIKDERALDVLLAPLAGSNKGWFSLQKKGIRINKAWYISPELGRHAVGDRLKVSQDVADMGRVFVFDTAGEFVCVAQNHELTGVSLAEIACETKAIQNKNTSEQKAALKKVAKKVDVKNIHAEIMRKRIEEVANVSLLQQPGTTHTTAGITAAGQAARADEGPKPSDQAEKLIEEARAAMAAYLAEEENRLAQKVVEHPATRQGHSKVGQMTRAEKYEYWLKLEDENTRTGDIEVGEDRRWHKQFHGCTSWRAEKSLREGMNDQVGDVIPWK